MRLFLFFFVSLSVVSACAQDLKAYYTCIHKAEDFILENRLDSSSLYFQRAFQHKRYPFARHVYNAAVVEAKLENYPTVTRHLSYLLQLGASFGKLRSASGLADYFLSRAGEQFARERTKLKPLYDVAYRRRIERMVQEDQYFRSKPNAYTRYGDTIQQIDRQNVAQLLALIEQKGYPAEEKIGIDSSNFLSPLYTLIVLHQSFGPLQQHDFSPLLREAVLKGNLENKAGAYLINRSTGQDFFQLVRVVYIKAIDTTQNVLDPRNHTELESTDWGYYPMTEQELAAANAKRTELYLDDYVQNLRKIVFSIRNTDYYLGGDGGRSSLMYEKYEPYLEEKKKATVLSYSHPNTEGATSEAA